MSGQMQHQGMLTNSLKASAAWKLGCFVFGGAVLFLAWSLVQMKTSQTVALAPYGLYSANTQVEIGDSVDESRDYINLLFRADISMLLNWQPKTVSKQFSAFMTRLSPGAYAKYNLDLRNKASDYREQNISQTFHSESLRLLRNKDDSDFVMEVEGYLKRVRGEEILIKSKVVYRLSYLQKVTGLFAIDNIETSYQRATAKES